MKKIVRIWKHIFIPHIHNDFKPHFFREVSIASILIVIIVLFSVSIGSKLYIKNTDMMSAVLPAVLVDLANQDRLANGASTLTRSPLLDTAARLKAEDMASTQYFAHTSPTGVTPWHWFSKVGYSFTYAGENLAIDFTESVDVEKAWLNSPKHKENIMNSRFTEIGIATVEGYYNGSPTTYVVQMFGTPLFAKKAEASTTPITKVTPKPAVVVQEKPLPIPETIVENKEFIGVKNTAIDEETILGASTTSTESPKYSTWGERLIFLFPNYTDKVYKVFAWIVLGALFLMLIIEIRRQHAKNIAYGVLLLVIIFCFIYINKAMFITSLLS